MTDPEARTLIIGIAGGTGSGKTTVAEKIVASLPEPDAALIQHDWYYKDLSGLTFEQRSRVNFDEPSSLDNELLLEHLHALRRGQSVEVPQYDFTSHLRSEQRVSLSARRIIVVEGILLFAVPALRECFDLRIFIDTADDIRLMRRIKRDLLHRNRDIESIQRQYYDTVRPMHNKHVAPSKRHCHLIVPEGGENRHAVDVIVGRLKYFLMGL